MNDTVLDLRLKPLELAVIETDPSAGFLLATVLTCTWVTRKRW